MRSDPIKLIQEDILRVMNPGQGYSSFQIGDLMGLGQKEHYFLSIDGVQEALGYLVDARRVVIRERGYWKP